MSRHEPGDIVWHGWFEITRSGCEVVLDPCVVVRWNEHNSEVRHIGDGGPVFWVGNEALYHHPEQFHAHTSNLIAKAAQEIAERTKAAAELVVIHQYGNAQ